MSRNWSNDYHDMSSDSYYGRDDLRNDYTDRYYGSSGSYRDAMSGGNYGYGDMANSYDPRYIDPWDMSGTGEERHGNRDQINRQNNDGRHAYYDAGTSERNTNAWTGDRHAYNNYHDRNKWDDSRYSQGEYYGNNNMITQGFDSNQERNYDRDRNMYERDMRSYGMGGRDQYINNRDYNDARYGRKGYGFRTNYDRDHNFTGGYNIDRGSYRSNEESSFSHSDFDRRG